MPSACRFALKEWAAVCAALETGRQCVLLRKGGIDEGPQGFRVEHDEFWLYPTQFHQSANQLVPEAASLAAQAGQSAPPIGRLHLQLFATVEHVAKLESLERLHALAGLHILSRETVESRFHYRTPGLFAILVRVWTIPQAHDLAERPADAGCHSWVTLADELSTAGARPVLDDATFAGYAADFHGQLG